MKIGQLIKCHNRFINVASNSEIVIGMKTVEEVVHIMIDGIIITTTVEEAEVLISNHQIGV